MRSIPRPRASIEAWAWSIPRPRASIEAWAWQGPQRSHRDEVVGCVGLGIIVGMQCGGVGSSRTRSLFAVAAAAVASAVAALGLAPRESVPEPGSPVRLGFLLRAEMAKEGQHIQAWRGGRRVLAKGCSSRIASARASADCEPRAGGPAADSAQACRGHADSACVIMEACENG
eukprot:CAMPEP_0203950058 /NCGR_PEP_ID=MMETSP0359-20131031/84304_1 /ASSEMBLY_ACC=CAM_ASM_000338 /TAXON_ID=268821 /ORGANISM="Scrippsiella Hangoei, Strain SHTV-5" /LENGTH=172 /DNA_ID=CAMNT_0050882167 /DNA_START=1 /DNA_END=517 /DNA_ORIENTATION=+